MDPNAYGRTSDIVVTAGTQWTHPIDRFLFMPSELVAGLEYSYNRLARRNRRLQPRHCAEREHLQRISPERMEKRKWGFLVGARVDKHSMIDNPVISPRANIRFQPVGQSHFEPHIQPDSVSPQAYDEDFHVAIVGGERVVTVLAPDSSRRARRA